MRETGIIRRVDELGRIVLPVEYRRALDIEIRDQIEFYLEDDKLILRKYEETCLFCSANRNLVSYMGKNVCDDCIQKMSKI